MKKKNSKGDFFIYEFFEMGNVEMCILDENTILLSINDASKLLGKHSSHLVTWMLRSACEIYDCTSMQTNRYFPAVAFDDYLAFCCYERNIADNPLAQRLLTNILTDQTNEAI